MGFSELKKISDTIQHANGVNQSLMKFEYQLRAMNLGVEAWVPLASPTHTQMGWKKNKPGPARLYCKTALNTEQPLLESPLEIRLEACEKIPQLISALEHAAAVTLDTIDRAMRKLKEPS